jgi:hypothetical protein
MALFKISKGSKANLPAILTEGFCWYTYDDSKFYIDHKDDNGILVRKALNAQDAETLMGASLATILNSSDLEIPTSSAVFNAIDAVKTDVLNMAAVVLAECQADTSNKAAVVLAEAQKSIDIAINERTDKISTISLPASGWTEAANIYSQVVTVTNATANSKVDIYPTPEQLLELQSVGISLVAVNEDGIVTVYALNNKPTSDYNMQVILTEVNKEV